MNYLLKSTLFTTIFLIIAMVALNARIHHHWLFSLYIVSPSLLYLVSDQGKQKNVLYQKENGFFFGLVPNGHLDSDHGVTHRKTIQNPTGRSCLLCKMADSPQTIQVFIETFGCQMNEYDTLVLKTIIKDGDIQIADDPEKADWILFNTCAVRENAEEKVSGRIRHYNQKRRKPKLGVIGCMARNQGARLLDASKQIHLVIGPDQYRRVPSLIHSIEKGTIEAGACFTDLSAGEQYSDILPDPDHSVSTTITIMRGCNNFCSFCVVPYTRGRERSRSPESILQEALYQTRRGVKEIILLGQNVNSYLHQDTHGQKTTFSELIEFLAQQSGASRIRFTSPHPKDFPDKLLQMVQTYPNICPQIHLPLQSGSDPILKAMKREYTGQEFLELTQRVRAYLPDVFLSTDVIFGFPGETEADAAETLRLMEEADFDLAFTFKYSEREHTSASRNLPDDIPDEVKLARVQKAVDQQQARSLAHHKQFLHQTVEVLIEGISRRSNLDWAGKTIWGHTVIFPKNANNAPGHIVPVTIQKVNAATLFGEQQ